MNNKQWRDLEGYYAIDVKSVRDQWRIIVQPLDDKQHAIIKSSKSYEEILRYVAEGSDTGEEVEE